MTDPEDLLRRFRPAGPPERLRAEIVGRDLWRTFAFIQWAPAAAALLLAVIFSALAANVRAAMGQQALDASGRPERERVLVKALGGDGFAQVEAARLIALEEEP